MNNYRTVHGIPARICKYSLRALYSGRAGKIFVVGDGEIGGKVGGLKEIAPLIEGPFRRAEIASGVSLGSQVVEDILGREGRRAVERGAVKEEIEQIVKRGGIPEDVRSVIQFILDLYDRPLAIRSDTIFERDGFAAGLHTTTFILNEGRIETTMAAFERALLECMLSYYTPEAIEYRKKHGIDAPIGITPFITPVVGGRFPFFSGAFMEDGGLEILRIVLGLGTKWTASDGEATIMTKDRYGRVMLKGRLQGQRYFHGVFSDGEPSARRTKEFEGFRDTKEPMWVLGYLDEINRAAGRNRYFEFAMPSADGPIVLLQSERMRSRGVVAAEDKKGTELGIISRVFSPGLLKTQDIVLVLSDEGGVGDGWSKFADINTELRNYLLILPDYIFTSAEGVSREPPIGYMTNAGGIVVMDKANSQVDWDMTAAHLHRYSLSERIPFAIATISLDVRNKGDTKEVGNGLYHIHTRNGVVFYTTYSNENDSYLRLV